MREVFADFMLLERLPDGCRRIRLHQQTIAREGLHEGDTVMLIEYGSLRAPARIEHVEGDGKSRWYGVITGAIEELDSLQIGSEAQS
jgi:hypothetical protein